MDASKLGTTVKEGKNQEDGSYRTRGRTKIIDTFNRHEAQEDFTVVVSYEQIQGEKLFVQRRPIF
mgnify:CR=1 FL=1